jgi:sulfite dehydrogenase (cytochrome) subunit A
MGNISRRDFLYSAAGTAGTLMVLPSAASAQTAASMLTPGVPHGIATYANMATLPGKKPLIQLADRPPNYEAPLEYFRTPITPNDQFFVRYHLADIPQVDIAGYKINNFLLDHFDPGSQ